MRRAFKKTDQQKFTPVRQDALKQLLERTGKQPPLTMVVTSFPSGSRVVFDRFLTYRFDSAINIPVDTFDFTAVAPDDVRSFFETVRTGYIVTIFVNNIALATGVVDTVEIETDADLGETVRVSGRDLMAQLEDNECVGLDRLPIFAGNVTVRGVLDALTGDTRIPSSYILQNIPNYGKLLFATDPGETKLSALQKFLKPINCLAWMSPEGQITVGKPNMKKDRSIGRFYLRKASRESNVLNMKVTDNSGRTVNRVVALYPGMEKFSFVAQQNQVKLNAATEPSRLFKSGHRITKNVTVNHPQGADGQSFADTNIITINQTQQRILDWYALSEIAMANFDAFQVQITVPRHLNDQGQPFLVDQVYHIEYDRADLDRPMYLYQVTYELTGERGMVTNLFFCDLGTLVAGVSQT